jgi:hypothetical protein
VLFRSSARRREPVSERSKLQGSERLKDVNLGHGNFQDVTHATDSVRGTPGICGAECVSGTAQFVKHLFEPELIRLVDDNE